MSDGAGQPARRAGSAKIGPLLREAGAVLVAGGVLALIANQLSPRGLRLSRDYFPQAAGKTESSATPAAGGSRAPSHVIDATNAVLARLEAHGLQPIELPRVEEFYRDPQFAQELILFVDARDDAHYQAGHIPGAYQFDHYHPENYLPAVLPACQTAQKIVVYCAGGECEDSEFAALTLHQAGVPLDRLFVYAGGFTEWAAGGRPVESGSRNSGTVRPAQP